VRVASVPRRRQPLVAVRLDVSGNLRAISLDDNGDAVLAQRLADALDIEHWHTWR
jgi:hypothetical protein